MKDCEHCYGTGVVWGATTWDPSEPIPIVCFFCENKGDDSEEHF